MYACVHLPDATGEQRDRLRKCAETFSPYLEEPAPGLLLFDLRGLARLFGTPHQIADAIRRQAPAETRIALAANPTAATAAARGLPGVTVILPGEEKERLGMLPVELLDPSAASGGNSGCVGHPHLRRICRAARARGRRTAREPKAYGFTGGRWDSRYAPWFPKSSP